MRIDEFRHLMKYLAKAIIKWAPNFADEDTVKIWYPSFGEMDSEKLKAACRLAIETLTEFPSIKQLKDLCEGNILADEEIGQDISSRIEKAISSYGYTNAKRAQEYVGELGWEIVRMCGGWECVCNLEYSELSSARKKWREQAAILYKKQRAFGEDKPIGLPSGERSNPVFKVIDSLRTLPAVK